MRPVASQVATVWAKIGSRWERRRGSASASRTTATEGGSDRGRGSKCRASAGPGRRPWPSTPPEAPGGPCAGPLSGCWRPGLAEGPGRERRRPPGPVGGGRPPPTARGACSPSPPWRPGCQRRPELKASGRTRPASAL